jgi:Zn-dependent peptidase ImmA (M78 family)
MEYKLKSDAAKFRNQYGYSNTEPIEFENFLQRLDIITLFKHLDDNFSGLSYKDECGHFMMVNCKHPLGRQNFTICHELYHLYLDTESSSQICKTGKSSKNKDNERKADIFASHLLLPEDGIVRMIPDKEQGKDSIGLGTILKIEQTYGSSRASLINRLISMGLVSKDYAESFLKQVKAGAVLFGFPTKLYENTPEHALLGTYGTLANKLFLEDKISESLYYELMLTVGIDVNEIKADEED